MTNNKLYISLTGVGNSGKDTLCQIFINKFKEKGLAARRMALADPIKASMRDYIFNSHSIDILNCSREDKEKVRPLLVTYGKEKRAQTNGRYFTDLYYEKSQEYSEDIIIGSDWRYAQFLHTDEAYVIKEWGGFLVHVARYVQFDGIREYVQPANADEAHNDPLMLAHSDFEIDWQTGPIEELKDHPQVNEVFEALYREYLDRKEISPA